MKSAWWLFVLAAVATVLSFPFPPPLLGVAGALIVIMLVVAAGLWCGARVGLGSKPVPLMRIVYSLLIGAAAGACVLALLPIAGLQSRIIKEASIPLWKWLVISFNAAVLEEIVFRLLMLSFVAWVLARFMRREPAIWIAIVVAALAFGAVHLPRWIAGGASPFVLAAVIVVNGLISIVLGRVYVAWGVEAAMLSHFAGDVIVHIVGPNFFAKG